MSLFILKLIAIISFGAHMLNTRRKFHKSIEDGDKDKCDALRRQVDRQDKIAIRCFIVALVAVNVARVMAPVDWPPIDVSCPHI